MIIAAVAVLSAVATSAIFLMNQGRREQATQAELKSLREQINNVGKKVNDNQTALSLRMNETEAAVNKRIRNLSVIVQFAAPDDKEKDIASLLKE
jgi:hypothetical protein